MIVIAMTSWTKRIQNVKPVIESILQSSVLPDRIYLSLSVQEFPNREDDLPDDLVELSKQNNTVIINWVEGENTKTMKKVFPILQYLDDDDIILNCDDDMLFPPNLIEKRLKDFNRYGGEHPISGKQKYTVNFFHKMITMSPTAMFKKKMLNHWEKVVNEDVIHAYNDDRLYIFIFWLNGYINKPCSCHEIDEMRSRYNYNVIECTGADHHLYLTGKIFDRFMIPQVSMLTKRNLLNSFGWLKQFD